MQYAIIGLGNPLRGDDGVGPHLVELLQRRGLPEGVTAIDGGTGGIGLLELLAGWERVVLVDAAEVGCAPGQFVRFTPDQARWDETQDMASLHQAGLAEVLALARALQRPLPPMVIFGVQPERLDWGEGLSPAVEAALPALADAVLAAIDEQP